MVGSICVEDHKPLLHTKYKKLWASWFPIYKKVFKAFLHCKSMETLDHQGGARSDPRGLTDLCKEPQDIATNQI